MQKLISYFLTLFFCNFSFCHSKTINLWEKTDFVWSAAIAKSCDVGLKSDPVSFFQDAIVFDPTMYENIASGDIVWLPCRFLPNFCETILSTITNPFVLVINDARDGDFSFPSNCPEPFDVERFLSNPYLIHCFAQNCDYQGSSLKVSLIPIGIDFHTIGYRGGGWGEKGSPLKQQDRLYTIIANSKPTTERKKMAYVDFHHSDSMHGEFKRHLQFGEDRKTIFERLILTGLIDHGPWMKRHSLWEKKAEYAFSISPPGNGLDCHRTWEDLALGCIVIVKTSPLDPMFEGLAVVIVEDWSEVTQENMDKWLNLYGDVLNNPLYREKLSLTYWINQISEKALPFKNKKVILN